MVKPNLHALFHAIYYDDLDSVKILIEKGIDIDVRDDEFKTPLMCAVYYERITIFKYLINHGADLFKMDLKHDMAIDYAYKTDTYHIQDILSWRMMHEESQKG